MGSQPPRELVQVGCYLREDQAEERGLVVLAQGLPYWILEQEGLFGLYVDGRDAEAASVELEKFETERSAEIQLQREELQQLPSPDTSSRFSLFIFLWTMLLFFGIQRYEGPHWTERGTADASAIVHGEVWRTVTALTLHADPGHLFANLATGLVFAWALLPLLGCGWTWMGLLLSGAAGNALNALIHQGMPHLSIGASTAVFGGLGLLVGWQSIAALQRQHGHRSRPFHLREIALPIAAGLCLLAYLGTGNGSDNVDIMAHGFGMLSGAIFGAIFAWTRLPEKTSPFFQKILASLAFCLPVVAWFAALNWR